MPGPLGRNNGNLSASLHQGQGEPLRTHDTAQGGVIACMADEGIGRGMPFPSVVYIMEGMVFASIGKSMRNAEG